MVADNRFDLDLLDEQGPFEIDPQAAHRSSTRTWESRTSKKCGPVTRCLPGQAAGALADVRGGVRPGVGGATGALT